MRVVVVGPGAREHAYRDALIRTAEVVVTPGNAGIPESVDTPPEELDADLFVIGPENPLVDGLADRLRAQGKLVLGPGADGARFEGSKSWMKEFFTRYDIPTARYQSFAERDAAVAFLDELTAPYVVKADGPAAGKGVFVAPDRDAAIADIEAKLSGSAFGEAGRRVVLEEGMTGPEISVFALTDGKRMTVLPVAQDFKRIGDGDTGPNTGGMGAYTPVPVATKAVVDEIVERILEPTIAGLRADGIDYRGFLYCNPMLTPDGPKMVEYNVRFGDPEAQVLLPLVDSDLAAILAQAAAGDLRTELRLRDEAAVTVVLAAAGYPDAALGGAEITGVEQAEQLAGVTVFHYPTRRETDGSLRAPAGRALSVTGIGGSIRQARERAYRAISHIRFEGMQYRTDIAAVAAEQEGSM